MSTPQLQQLSLKNVNLALTSLFQEAGKVCASQTTLLSSLKELNHKKWFVLNSFTLL
jgi:hypothetical protein